jgi:dihydroneopterin aldolase
MYTIFAKGILINKKAGVYQEEKSIYNQFIVDIEVVFEQLINEIPTYEFLVQTTNQTASFDFDWIETWAEKLIDEIKNKHPKSKVKVVIRKLNPAFSQIQVQEVGVCLQK